VEQNKTTYTPEALAALGADELAQILREQLQKSACEMDDDLVRQLLRELETRGKDPTLTDDMAVERACEKYRQNTTKSKRPRYRSWLITAASVAVVLGILLFTLPGTAEAENIKGVLARWTDNVFQFFSPGGPAYAAEEYVFETDNPGLQEIYDEVVAMGITHPVVPMWIPEGFKLSELKKHQMVGDTSVFASFMKDQSYFFIALTEKSKSVSFQHEKNSIDIEVIEIAGTEHYIIQNNGEYIIAWVVDNIECSIITDCQEDEIHKFLYSIYIPEE